MSVLQTIRTSEARIGMFVHAVEGGWLASPFWRAQLVLTRPSEIRKLIKAGIDEIVIDTSKGIGPAPADAADAAPLTTTVPEPGDAATDDEPAHATDPRHARRRAPTSIERARATVERAKTAIIALFEEVRLGQMVTSGAVVPMVEDIARSVQSDAAAMHNVTRLKTKDEYTYLHSIAVAALMIHFGRHLQLPEDEVTALGIAGLLHDIGKIAVPNALLQKTGRLEPPEMMVLRHHPEKGHALLRRAGDDVSPVVLDVCLHHHERMDGRGYPFGLTAAQLSLPVRISAICDVYDAVTSIRPYKRPWSPNDALARMRSWTGHFDEDLLEQFIGSIGIHPVGELVRLRSSRLALVIEGNDRNPTAPRVRAFYDIPATRFITPVDLWAADDADGDPIHCSERGALWFNDTWSSVRHRVWRGQIPETDLPMIADAAALPSVASL